jgi:hypothetical protein
VAAAKLPVGWVEISSEDPKRSVVARLGDERPDVASGFGGWEAVERPRRKPLTYFKSSPGLQLTLPILLDEWVSGASIERQIDHLQDMGSPTASDGDPPQLRVRAAGGAVPFQAKTWVLGDLSFGDALMNEDGNRCRQFVTLTLWEYVEDRYIVERSAANRRRRKHQQAKKKRGAAAKRVVAKRSSKKKKAAGHAVAGARDSTLGEDFGAGEDLVTIAGRELGDPDRWIEIAELNGLRDPRAVAPGQVLRLP